MRTIGLIGGMSWQSSKIYYERINELVGARLGQPHSASLILVSLDFAPIAHMQSQGRWKEAGALLAEAARRLELAGAEAVAICANTMHKAAAEVKAATRLPLLHIGECLAQALRRDARCRPLLLGTRYTMEDMFMRDHLAEKGIEAVIPDEAGRRDLHAIIYDDLIRGKVTDAARARVRGLIDEAGEQEADCVIFGCTEIGMLFGPSETGLPGYDTLELHARALADFALDGSF